MRRIPLLAAFALVAACGSPPEITRTPPDAPTRAEYTKALVEFGLTRAALGKDWIAAGEQALAAPVVTAPPFREAGYLAPDEPAAVAYRFDVRRGRKIVIDVTFESVTPARLFIDLFQFAPDGSDQLPVRVAEADPGALRLEYEARRDAPHVIRLQPEILRGGRYTIVYRTEAALAFPVPGLSLPAIHSTFGAPRDAGRRSHHGVDIFAPRGTPVVAAADGVVSVRTSDLGGQVIWLRDRRGGRRLYYAHLNGWAVADGADVKIGDVIGFVGNTGNARTTPPHLHFGVYERGPAVSVSSACRSRCARPNGVARTDCELEPDAPAWHGRPRSSRGGSAGGTHTGGRHGPQSGRCLGILLSRRAAGRIWRLRRPRGRDRDGDGSVENAARRRDGVGRGA